MRFSLTPKEGSFFDLFEKSAAILHQAAQLLVETMENFDKLKENGLRMERLEHEGDKVVHEISARLNQTFLTPIDREDIHYLASRLDDVLDLVEQSTERFVLFKVDCPTEYAKDLARIIAKQAEQIHSLVPRLRDPEKNDIYKHLVEINRLENAADQVLRNALGELFDGRFEPMFVIRWSHLYDILERATDKAEDVANIIENILVKNR
jgi:predicted phosphate transport protein (TIGR00153 family)